MNGIFDFIYEAELLIEKAWKAEIETSFYVEENQYKITNEFAHGFHKDVGFNLFTNFGRQLRSYKYFNREYYIPLLRRVYILDVINSVKQLTINDSFCFTEYTESNIPHINAKGLWHPSLKNPVYNDIELSGKSMILTGPNAGGKSTLIKSILITILLSQTIGLSNTRSMSMTPFAYINSQINIPDCKGKESLFEAEMYRSKENLNILSSLKDTNDKSIIFMDEIFNSTNPVEGISGAYAIIKNMSDFSSNITIFTTHFLYLTKLAKDLPEKFTNMKMNVQIEKDKTITYPYRVSKGISRQFIALELLKQNGFDKKIVDDALIIKENLLRQN